MERAPEFSENNLVWMDLEMTGLDFDNDRIIQVAVMITDKDLNVLSEGPTIVLNQPEEIIGRIDRSHPVLDDFFNSGLIDEVRSSEYNESSCEQEVIEFISRYVPKRTSPLCGNSVYTDRMFIIKHMPILDKYLHYRLIDVTTLKELYKRWVPDAPLYKKKEVHRAYEDIVESINELAFYREHFITL